ncbi:MAG: type II secretion system protein [Synergistaceae bacterium]|nr:type II secretion system protein [Synergistaceae bacterium]
MRGRETPPRVRNNIWITIVFVDIIIYSSVGCGRRKYICEYRQAGRQAGTNAFTLVEVLITIVVIGILAGLMMISSGSATDKAEETACLNNRKVLQREYNVRHSTEASKNFESLMDEVLQAQNRGIKIYSSPVFYSISDICPAKGVVAASLPDIRDSSRVTVACALHSDNLDDTLFVQLSNLLNKEDIVDIHSGNVHVTDLTSYFDTGNRAGNIEATLDSTGVNFGQYFKDYLARITGLDMSSYPWQIQRTSLVKQNGNYNYTISWSTQKIDNLQKGDTISVTRYSTETGKTETGTAKVTTKVNGGKTIKVFDMTTFVPD